MIPNQWYAIYLSKDVKKKPVGIKRFNQNLILWRDVNGKLVCMPDKCCHRKAKLSLGKMNNGCLACPYHGFEYNTEGKVCKIPAHDEKEEVPSRFHVTPFVVRELEGLIWFWYSTNSELKPLESLPWDDFLLKKFNAKASRTVISADTFSVSYLRLLENITDLIHVPFVHAPFVPSSWSVLKDFSC
jgi:phenylpropionate dioxygenase-like ring-hydroxylating dioxygenase large terminal subunit